MKRAPAQRVAMVGTFDVGNFGDLLFPLIAEHELKKRDAAIEVVRYSYRAMAADAWPYSVRPLSGFAADLQGFDLVLVGGGHLVRFGKHVAPGYIPTDAGLHHPTAYWLLPTLLARAAGIPVAWNALGVSPDTPAWARPLLALAVQETPYVSARDEASAAELLAVAPGAPVRIVPDTGLGARDLVPAEPSERFRAFCAGAGITGRYAIVQPSPLLAPHALRVAEAVEEIRTAGMQVLELPISPILGDAAGVFPLEPSPCRPAAWPDPLLLAEVIGRSDAVIAQSLHLSLVALACGVPVHRFRGGEGSKYQRIERFQGALAWDHGTDAEAAMRARLGRRAPGTDVQESLRLLTAHWDAIAALVGARTAPRPGITASVINACVAALEKG